MSLDVYSMILSSGEANSVVVTYGEATHANSNYKSTVDSFFTNQAHADLNSAESKIISADDVNKISTGITGKTYGSDQILWKGILKN